MANGVGGAGEGDEAAEQTWEMLTLPFSAVPANIALVRKVANDLSVQALLSPPQPSASSQNDERADAQGRLPERPVEEDPEQDTGNDAQCREKQGVEGTDAELDQPAPWPLRSERSDRVEHADEIRRGVRPALFAALVMRAVLIAESAREFLAFILELVPWMPGPVLKNVGNRFLGDVVDGAAKDWKRASRGSGGNTAQTDQVGDSADRIGAAAEADEKDPVARPVMVDDEGVALGDVRGDAAPGDRATEFLHEAHRRR